MVENLADVRGKIRIVPKSLKWRHFLEVDQNKTNATFVLRTEQQKDRNNKVNLEENPDFNEQ